MRAVVAGLGNPFRRDDGVGRLVAGRAALDGLTRDVGPVEAPLDLLGRWDGAPFAVVVDAVQTGSPPGALRVVDLEAASSRAAGAIRAASTHTVDLIDAWRLGRAIGAAPARAVVLGVEGQDFGWGTGLSPAVRAAVFLAARRVTELIRRANQCA